MSPKHTHKLMGFHIEVLGVIYVSTCFLLLLGCIGFNYRVCRVKL